MTSTPYRVDRCAVSTCSGVMHGAVVTYFTFSAVARPSAGHTERDASRQSVFA